MSLLTQIKTGKVKKPWHVLLYGTPKVGKTTWASDAEAPIFLDVENGSGELNVNRFVPKSFTEALGFLTELTTAKHEFKTLVIDSMDALETMANQEVATANGVAASARFSISSNCSGIIGRALCKDVQEVARLYSVYNNFSCLNSLDQCMSSKPSLNHCERSASFLLRFPSRLRVYLSALGKNFLILCHLI